MLQARPWLPPWGTESWPARTPWVKPQGFFSGRGKSLVLWRGNSVNVLSEKRERGLPDFLTALAGQPERELPARPLRGFLATRSGEGGFSSGKICARVNGPQNGSLRCGEAPESLVSSTQKGHTTIRRGWLARATCPRGPTVEKEARESKRERKRKERKGRAVEWSLNNLSQFGILAVLE